MPPSSKIKPAKACKILKHGSVRGRKLSSKQRKMFGAACSNYARNNRLKGSMKSH